MTTFINAKWPRRIIENGTRDAKREWGQEEDTALVVASAFMCNNGQSKSLINCRHHYRELSHNRYIYWMASTDDFYDRRLTIGIHAAAAAVAVIVVIVIAVAAIALPLLNGNSKQRSFTPIAIFDNNFTTQMCAPQWMCPFCKPFPLQNRFPCHVAVVNIDFMCLSSWPFFEWAISIVTHWVCASVRCDVIDLCARLEIYSSLSRWMSLIYNRIASQNGIIEAIASEIFSWNRLRGTIPPPRIVSLSQCVRQLEKNDEEKKPPNRPNNL